MRTHVVIVNYRTASLTIECLASLAPEVAAMTDHGGVSVVVTDNASGDGSAEAIAAAVRDRGWSDWCTVMPLPKNGGFAYGNNRGIEPALASADPPQYVWLLNPDTVVRAGALSSLIAFLDRTPAAGIVGSRLEDPDGTPQRSAFRFHSPLSEVEWALRFGPVSRLLASRVVAPPPPTEPARTDWLAGASLLIRREVFGRIGFLDEQYFMYFEEVDFCRRAAHAGFECWYVPQSRVVHLVGQASGVTDVRRRNQRRPAYWFESRRRYFLTHAGRFRTVLADGGFLAGYALWRVRRRLQGKPDGDPARLLGDFTRQSVFLRGFSVAGGGKS